MAKRLKNLTSRFLKSRLVQSAESGVSLYAAFELFTQNQFLKNEVERLKSETLTDSLTGLGNSRRLAEDLGSLLRARLNDRANRPSVIFIDVDRFKLVNENHGHLAASELLRLVARRLQRVLRENDGVYRYAGDEFVVILPTGGEKAARYVAQRILRAISLRPFDLKGFLGANKVSLTVSLGIRVLHPMDSVSQLLEEADKALFEAKRKSRNTFQIAV